MAKRLPDSITVNIIKAEKYKGRKDNIHNSWFRLSNRLLEDPDFFDFTHEEILVWIYILSVSSQKNSGQVLVLYAHAGRICRLSRSAIDNALAKLKRNQIVTTSKGLVSVPNFLDKSATIQNNTKQDITKQNKTPPDPHGGLFDFEKLYENYPKKEGKKSGLAKLRVIITSDEDLKKFQTAMSRYIENLKVKKTEAKYIQKFSTFVNNWTDWLDDDSGSAQGFEEADPFDEFMKRREAENDERRV